MILQLGYIIASSKVFKKKQIQILKWRLTRFFIPKNMIWMVKSQRIPFNWSFFAQTKRNHCTCSNIVDTTWLLGRNINRNYWNFAKTMFQTNNIFKKIIGDEKMVRFTFSPILKYRTVKNEKEFLKKLEYIKKNCSFLYICTNYKNEYIENFKPSG